MILPDMLKNAPMLKNMSSRGGRGGGGARGKSAILGAQAGQGGRGGFGGGRGGGKNLLAIDFNERIYEDFVKNANF